MYPSAKWILILVVPVVVTLEVPIRMTPWRFGHKNTRRSAATTTLSLALRRAPDGRILVPPVLPWLKVYLLSENDSSTGNTLQYSDFIWCDKSDELLERNQPRFVTMTTRDMTYEEIFSKVIDYYKRYVLFHRKSSLTVKNVRREFELYRTKNVLEMTGGKLFNLTDVYLFSRVTISNLSTDVYMDAELRFDQLTYHYDRYQMTVNTYNLTLKEPDSVVLTAEETGWFTFQVKKILFRLKVSLNDIDNCQSSLEYLQLLSIADVDINFSNDLDVLDGKDKVLRDVKLRFLNSFKRTLRGPIKTYFARAVKYVDICKYVMMFSESVAADPVFISAHTSDPNDDFPKFRVPDL